MTGEPETLGQIGLSLGLSRGALYQVLERARRRGEDVPRPVQVAGRFALYEAGEVAEWYRDRGSPCWYYTYVTYCAECGRETVSRERRQGEKPERPEDRREYIRQHCGCVSGGFA